MVCVTLVWGYQVQQLSLSLLSLEQSANLKWFLTTRLSATIRGRLTQIIHKNSSYRSPTKWPNNVGVSNKVVSNCVIIFYMWYYLNEIYRNSTLLNFSTWELIWTYQGFLTIDSHNLPNIFRWFFLLLWHLLRHFLGAYIFSSVGQYREEQLLAANTAASIFGYVSIS